MTAKKAAIQTQVWCRLGEVGFGQMIWTDQASALAEVQGVV